MKDIQTPQIHSTTLTNKSELITVMQIEFVTFLKAFSYRIIY